MLKIKQDSLNRQPGMEPGLNMCWLENLSRLQQIKNPDIEML